MIVLVFTLFCIVMTVEASKNWEGGKRGRGDIAQICILPTSLALQFNPQFSCTLTSVCCLLTMCAWQKLQWCSF